MRKNQLTSTVVVVVDIAAGHARARAFGFGKVINFQLSLFACLLF